MIINYFYLLLETQTCISYLLVLIIFDFLWYFPFNNLTEKIIFLLTFFSFLNIFRELKINLENSNFLSV